jgi:hypothetical protein
MTGSLEDEIHRAREQANILAEEARVIGENSNERVKAANEGARKTKERLSSCKRNPARLTWPALAWRHAGPWRRK